MNFISAQTGDRAGTHARYIDRIDPQRDWIEKKIRQSEKREKSGFERYVRCRIQHTKNTKALGFPRA